MVFKSTINRVLKRGRTERLPEDSDDALYHLLPLVIEGKYRAVASLLSTSETFDVNVKMKRDGRTLLHQAVTNADTATALLEAGADPKVQDKGGCTPLHIAARNGSPECIQILINRGADVNMVDNEGMTPLHYAALHGKIDLLKTVARVMRKEKGLTVLDVTDVRKRTPLSYAADNGHDSIVEYLLKHGAVVDAADDSGQTSLLRASSRGHEGCMRLLLEFNADVKQRSRDGYTVLEVLVQKGNTGCVSLLNQPVSEIIKLFGCADVEYDNVIGCIDHLNSEKNVKWEFWDSLVDLAFRHAEELLGSNFDVSDRLFCKYINALKHIRRLPDYKEGTGFVRKGSSKEGTARKGCTKDGSLKSKSLERALGIGGMSLRSYTMPSYLHSSNMSMSSLANALDGVWEMLDNHMSIVRQYLVETHQTLPSPGTRPNSWLETNTNIDPLLLPDVEPQTSTSSPVAILPSPDKIPRQIIGINQYTPTESPNVIEIDSEGSSLHQELEDPVAKLSLHLCCLIEGYHTWCKNTTQFKEFLDFTTLHASVIKVFVQRDHQLIFNELNFLLESPIAMKQFQNIRSAMYKEGLEKRKSWMYTKLYERTGIPDNNISSNVTVFSIDRENVFGSSCEQIMGVDSTSLQDGIAIKFEGDEGIGSGLRKEWFTLITDLITDGNYGLFQLCNDGLNFQPSKISHIHPDHLSHFEFAGRVMGLSIYYKNTIDIHFTKSFYKQILGIPVDYTDVACIDKDVAQALQWCLDNDIGEQELTFSIDEDNFDTLETIELKPGGSHIIVTEGNKHEYVELYSEYKLTNAIKSQIHSFLKGFFEIIPRSYVAVFEPRELELIMCGLPDIDKLDWRKNTQYGGGYTDESVVINWFWDVVTELSQKDSAKLLRFFTGYARVPHGGFSQIGRNILAGGIKIDKLKDSEMHIPKASVCFNTLHLPEYSRKEVLKEKLRTVIEHSSEGFELA